MPIIDRHKSAWWQVLVGLATLVMAIGIVFQVVSSALNIHEAIRASKSATDSEQQQRSTDAQIVAGLNAQLKRDSGQLLVVGKQNARLLADIQALDKQIESWGGVPVAVETVVVPAPTPSAGPSTAPPSRVRPSPKPSKVKPHPSPAPSPSPGMLGGLLPTLPAVPSIKGL